MTRPYHHGNLKSALVLAAREQLRRSPAPDLSLRELARVVGVSPNAPYRHFPDKDGLTGALVAAGYQQLTQLAEKALTSDRPLANLTRQYQQFGVDERALLDLVDREDFLGRDPESEVVLARDEWFAVLVAIVEKEAGPLKGDEAYRRAAGVWAMLQGLRQLRHCGGRGLLPPELHPDAAELAGRIARGR